MISEKGVEDVGCILLSPVQVHLCVIQPVLILLFPGILPAQIFVQYVGIGSGIPACAVGAVFFNQLRALPKPCHILRIVPRGLCIKISKLPEHLNPNGLLGGDLLPLNGFVKIRVGVLSVCLQLQVKGLVIDAGAGILKLFVLGSQPLCQHSRSSLYAVAQPGNVHVRHGLQIAYQHSHGIGVILK